MLEIIRSILERKVWDALLLEKFKNFFKKEDTQIKFFIKINKKPNISPFPIGIYSERKKLCYISAGKGDFYGRGLFLL